MSRPKPLHYWYIKRENGCWEWLGGKNKSGYGRVRYEGKSIDAHVAVYRYIKGGYDTSLELDHLCNNPICVNPDHLEPVTHRENMFRGLKNPIALNSRKTHCVNGHELIPENIRMEAGSRRCLICKKISRHFFRRKK